MLSILQDTKEDIADVVRHESTKKDKNITKSLQEVNTGKFRKDTTHLNGRQQWMCKVCGYRNFESRLVCGECLEPHKDAIKGFTTTRRSNTKKATDVSNATEMVEHVLKQARGPNGKRPGVSLEEGVAIISLNGRCYRNLTVSVPVGAIGDARQRSSSQERHKDSKSDEEGVKIVKKQEGNNADFSDDDFDESCDDEDEDSFKRNIHLDECI
eukprot:Tbor_TRINITY_DN4871_c0_g1::TRINITY_DN4871_c0_g1_i1::g.1520::m.1520